MQPVQPPDQAQALGALCALLGSSKVDDASAARNRYGLDTSDHSTRLAGAVRVRDRGQVQAVMKVMSEHGARVHPISSGHNWGYGSSRPSAANCWLLDLSAMQRILDFDADLGTITVEPGVTQALLSNFLDEGNHPFLVPVTGAGPSCSIMANALERGYGVTPISDHFAAVTDLQAVLPNGSLYRSMMTEAGGAEAAKIYRWGIGPYAHGLFTQGGLGVVTQVTLLLARRPQCTEVCLFGLRDESLLEPAVTAVRELVQRLPGTVGGINLMSRHRVLAMSAPYPFESVGDDGLLPKEVVEALGREYQVMPWTGFCTLYGTARVTRAARQEIRQALRALASRLLFVNSKRAKQLAGLARWVPGRLGVGLRKATSTLQKSLELVGGRPNETALPLAYWLNRKPPPENQQLNPARDGCGLIWYAPLVPMRGSDASRFVTWLQTVTARFGIEPLITFTTINQAAFDSTVPLLFDRSQPGASDRAKACYNALLAEGCAQGFFPYRVGPDAMESLRVLAPDAIEFHRKLTSVIDPSGQIAPNRYR